MTDEQIFNQVRIELAKARSRYAWWPADMVHAAAIANEESGEVVKAVNNRYWSHGDDTWTDIQKEAIQAIAMWVRFLTETGDVDAATMRRNQETQGVIFVDGDVLDDPSKWTVSIDDTYANALLRHAGECQ